MTEGPKMNSRIRKAAFLGSVTFISLVGMANAGSKSDATHIPVPSPRAVLEGLWGEALLKGVPGEEDGGAASYVLAPSSETSGDIVSLWFNYQFLIAGERYYTGFTTLEWGEGSPEAGLLFGQQTYRLDTAGREPFWKPFHRQNDVGEMPGVMKADQIDETRDPEQYVTSNQHLVLAIPTTNFASGETINSFTIFAFDPAKNDIGNYKSWQYLGSVVAGRENSASCGADLPTPCVSSTGTLSFVSPASGAMPVIRVNLSGTQIDSPGKTRTLGANDAVEYKFDKKTRQYEQAAGN
ncbi:hypothetical protein NIBR502774_14270 (plasmid) [Rhizobium sp. NIBRBAC000502774]|nr:hypothetical protein NIBR502774_14270 [Rhizobium sp. NIBRBAC000502774]